MDREVSLTAETKSNAANGKSSASGHRDRLKKAFLAGESTAHTEASLLELLLFQIVPIQDVKPRVEELLRTHGTLQAVLQAQGEWPAKLRTALTLMRRLAEELPSIAEAPTTAKPSAKPSDVVAEQPALFEPQIATPTPASPKPAVPQRPVRQRQGIAGKVPLREAIRTLPGLASLRTEAEARDYLRAHLRFNSAETRDRYSSYVLRQMFPGGYPDPALQAFAARFAGTLELQDVCYYQLCQAEPLLVDLADELLSAALPAGELDRVLLTRYLQSRYPGSRSIADYKTSVVEALKSGGIAESGGSALVLRYRALRPCAFAFILHREFPQPGMHQIEALQESRRVRAMLWRAEDLLPALYELRNCGLIAKISEIDRFRQFTTAWTPEELVQHLPEGETNV